MITAIIRNKENTLVLDLPHSIYDIYEKLRSIGIMQPPKRIPLTDNEGEDIGVKLFSESDFGQHLLLTLNEKNTIADANMLTLVIGAASEDIKEELEQNILYDQYWNTIFLYRSRRQICCFGKLPSVSVGRGTACGNYQKIYRKERAQWRMKRKASP